MPPKLQKKEGAADSPASTASATKENDVVSIDDILFPKATVSRIAKSVFTEGDNVEESEKSQFLLSKDSLTVIQRSSVVFISHLFHHALQVSKLDTRRTVNAQDVLNALKGTGFGAYLPILEEELEKFNERTLLKRQTKQSSTKADSEVQDEEEVDEDVEEDSNKKLKTNEGTGVDAPLKKGTATDIAGDDEEEGETPVEIERLEEVDEVEEIEEDDDVKLKPSQIVAKEHKELEGESPESVYEDAEQEGQEEES